MQFVTVGTTSSELEYGSVARDLKGARLFQAVELLGSLSRIEAEGFVAESARWDAVPQAPDVKVYYGLPERGSNEGAIWAAIKIGPDGKSVTLLKITDAYRGGDNERDDLLADALHRRDRS